MGMDKTNKVAKMQNLWNDAIKDGRISQEERTKIEQAGICEDLKKAIAGKYVEGQNGELFLLEEIDQKPQEASLLGGLLALGTALFALLFSSCSPADEYTEFGDNNINASISNIFNGICNKNYILTGKKKLQ